MDPGGRLRAELRFSRSMIALSRAALPARFSGHFLSVRDHAVSTLLRRIG